MSALPLTALPAPSPASADLPLSMAFCCPSAPVPFTPLSFESLSWLVSAPFWPPFSMLITPGIHLSFRDPGAPRGGKTSYLRRRECSERNLSFRLSASACHEEEEEISRDGLGAAWQSKSHAPSTQRQRGEGSQQWLFRQLGAGTLPVSSLRVWSAVGFEWRWRELARRKR